MKEIKTNKYKGSWFLKFSLLCFVVVVVYMLINQQVQIQDKEERLNFLQEEIEVQKIKNDEIKYMLENEEEFLSYAEKIARRDMNFAKPGEKVFINIGGSDWSLLNIKILFLAFAGEEKVNLCSLRLEEYTKEK